MNETVNTTGEIVNTPDMVGKAGEVAASGWEYIPLILERMWDLISAPFKHHEMLWILLPLILTFVVLEFYFNRHRDDELGWAAAVANSLILFIVAIDLLKHSFHYASPFVVFKEVGVAAFTEATLPLAPQVFIMIIFLGLLGIVITIVNYYHLLPSKLMFEVSGHPPVNFLAFMAIVIVYTTGTDHAVPLDIPTLIAGVVVYVIVLYAMHLVRRSLGSYPKKKKKKSF